ncbi:MAG TPA: enoyl-CoA hydratase/isomerase family protein [Streptosporangiaceae bacterium]|jgi:enoyl-CoA hydratase/carnithine racemase
MVIAPGEFTELDYGVRDGVAWLYLNRPHARNACTPRLYQELRWAIRAANSDESVDLLVLSGRGTAFCAGADLKESQRLMRAGGSLAMHDFTDQLPFDDLRDSGKTVIAAVNGACYGSGVVMAVWCDLSVAVASARFSLPEARLGAADSFTPSVLFGRVPAPKLKHMIFTGVVLSAEQAESYGLIGEVVPDGTLENRVSELIAEVRTTSPDSRRIYKRMLNELVPRPFGRGREDS